MISICMATYNGQQYLQQQLQSILRQLGPEDEIIVSDDSSTDETIAIIKACSDSRIRLYTDNSFYSPIYNFENALKQATGDIIVLSDQDDLWLENKLRIVKDKFKDHSGEIYTVMMNADIIDDHGHHIGETLFQRVKAGPGLIKNIYDNCYTGCAMAFSKELLEVALPFPPGIPMHDSWLGLLSELFGKVEFVPAVTMHYRRHSSNTSYRHRNVLQQIRWRLVLTWQVMSRYIEMRNRQRG